MEGMSFKAVPDYNGAFDAIPPSSPICPLTDLALDTCLGFGISIMPQTLVSFYEHNYIDLYEWA